MIDGKLLYFTPAEFVVMMELSGKEPYSMMFIREDEIEDAALTQAFTTLFQRDLISRKGTGFEPGPKGQLFKSLRKARFVVMISMESVYEHTAGCYVAEDALWLVECTDNVLSKQFRVQEIKHDEIQQWLLEKGTVNPPILSEGNVEDLLKEEKDSLERSDGKRLFKLERYQNGGLHICTYELLAADRCNIILRRMPDKNSSEIYTVEAMSHMLAECFGKD